MFLSDNQDPEEKSHESVNFHPPKVEGIGW